VSAETSGSNAGGGSGGPDINILTNNGGSADATDAGCQHFAVDFVPKIPSVFVLVDRSDSMFTPDDTTHVTSWDPLKTGVLAVIAKLQDQVRFGFGAFSGQQGGMCPIFDTIAPALDNARAISNVYTPLGRLMGAKGETPVTEVLPLVRDLLNKPGNDGDKYILFVTDGEPDFCDDGDHRCAVDAVVGQVQKLATQGIHTIVFGIKSSQSNISAETLKAVANAGASQPVLAPFGGDTTQTVCQSCSGAAGWMAEWSSMASAPSCATVGTQTLGNYSASDGTATVYNPDPANEAALTDQVGSVVSGIKSCVFDLGGQISVDLTQLNRASVSLEGQRVPLSMANGWRMNDDSQLELVGDACIAWRDPKNTHIEFNFPCDILIPR